MPRAVLNGTVLADSSRTVMVEGNHYFPAEDVRWDRLGASRMRTVCPWKGIAAYQHAIVDGETVRNVAWTYRRPLPFARRIRGHVAFSPWVAIEESDDEELSTVDTTDGHCT